MDKSSAIRAHMMAKTMYRVHTGYPPYTDGEVDRLNALYSWFRKTGRQDIITEAERICDEMLSLKGLK